MDIKDYIRSIQDYPKKGILFRDITTLIKNENAFTQCIDDIVKKSVEIFISDEKYKNKLIFDGYPRNLIQAKTLKELLSKYNQKIDLVLKLSVSLETIKKRIVERKTLEKRADDSEEIAIKRYRTYEKSTEPVIEYYKKLNLLKVIDGERSIDQINKEISDIIDLI